MPKRKYDSMGSNEPKKKTLYTAKLTDEQMDKLNAWCSKQLWMAYSVDHARFAYKGSKVNVVAYKSGKVVVQGKGTEDFVTFVLEPEITQEILFGYEEVHHPEWYELHAGVDESGKGDLFGPLVSACVIADGDMVRSWVEKGLQDSKKITTDKAILGFEKMIRSTKGVVVKTTFAGMEKYNELYAKFGSNLNKLLAWMHSKSVEDALKERHAPWGMLDQFSKQPLVQRLLKVQDFELRMETKAECDPVVAAASVIARAQYVKQMEKLSENFGETLGKGASAKVKAQAADVVRKFGEDGLRSYAKMHFKTAREAIEIAQR